MKQYSIVIISYFLGALNANPLSAQIAQTIDCQGFVFEITNNHQLAITKSAKYEDEFNLYSRKIYIPDSMYVGNEVYYVSDLIDAFMGCKYLKEIHLPANLTYIAPYAFAGCKSLQKIDIPNYISSINEGTFLNCRSLLQVQLSANLRKIGCSAFERCTHLKSIELSQQVDTIEQFAFAGCRHLNRLVISKHVSFIGFCAFSECKGLKEIFVYAENPPTLENGPHLFPSVFEKVRKNIIIHIPKGTKPLYMQADEWATFTNYIEDL